MNTVPSVPPQGRRTMTLKPKRPPVLMPKLVKWLTTPASTQLSAEAARLLRNIEPQQRGLMLGSVTDLVQMGFSAEDMATVAHAVQHRRILGFHPGVVADLGEYARPYDGRTTGSAPYPGEFQ